VNMRFVVRTTRRPNHKTILRFQQRTKLNRLRQIPTVSDRLASTPNPTDTNQVGVQLGIPARVFHADTPIGRKASIKSRTPPPFSNQGNSRIPCTTSRRNRVDFKTPPYFPSRVIAPQKSCPNNHDNVSYQQNQSKFRSGCATRQKSSMMPPMSPSVKHGKSADKASRRSRIDADTKILAPPGMRISLQYRPECVSCNPTSKIRVRASSKPMLANKLSGS